MVNTMTQFDIPYLVNKRRFVLNPKKWHPSDGFLLILYLKCSTLNTNLISIQKKIWSIDSRASRIG